MTRIDLSIVGWTSIRFSGSALVECALNAQLSGAWCPTGAHRQAAFPEARSVARARVATVWSWGFDGWPGCVDAESVDADVAGLTRFWRRELVRAWPCTVALIEAEVVRRSVALALTGARCAASAIPGIAAADQTIIADDARDDAVRPEFGPIVFCPTAAAAEVRLWSFADFPVIIYPVRRADLKPAATAAALFGQRRAAILIALQRGGTTVEIAAMLGVSPSAVSQHLRQLNDAGLVSGTRAGRYVFYTLTAAGVRLVDAMSAIAEDRLEPADS